MARNWFTEEELERSAEAGERYANVTPEELFKAGADSRLTMAVQKNDPVRYRALRLEYKYRTGQLKRPDSHYQ